MDLDTAFKGAAARLGLGRVRAEFYPFSELRHTWTHNGGELSFRISDYLEGAPQEIIESLSGYLLCRAQHMTCAADVGAPYLAYANSRAFWASVKETYLSRARRLSFEADGGSRNLKIVFNYVNSRYFSGRAPEPILAWVSESPRRRLGFYFEPLRLLAANRILDSESIPRYVLEFVMYHELLHHLSAGDGGRVRRVHHTKQFKAQERAFTHFEEAESWLRRIVCARRSR